MKNNLEGQITLENQINLPNGWTTATISDVCVAVASGGTPSRAISDYFGGSIVWLTPTEIPKERIAIMSDSKEKITKKGLDKSSAKIIPKGTVLLTSRATIGAVAIAGCEVSTNQGFASLICSQVIHNLYLAYWLWANKDLLQRHAKGTTFKEISKSTLKELSLPLPPVHEQHRIVSKIEELFTKLDAGIEYLKETQTLLKQYRQSVLNYAFEGKLTEKWRKGRDKNTQIQITSSLLESIRNELKESADKNSIARDKNSKYNLEPIKNLDQDKIRSLPESWLLVHIGEICYKIENGTTPLRSNSSNFDSKGIPFIKVENIGRDGRVTLKEDQLRITRKIHEKNFKSKVAPNDVLMNIVGPPLGKIGLVTCDIKEANINQNIVVMRPVSGYNPKILLYCLLSPHYYKLMIKISTGVRQSAIRKSHVHRILIPFMCLDEQEIIVNIIENQFSIIDSVEKLISSLIKKSMLLRKNILRNAFNGKLISQDPGDEPADYLFKRINQVKSIESEAITLKKGKSMSKQRG